MAHRRGGFRKKIETVHWTLGSWEFVNQSAGTAALTVLAAQHLPETLMRIRGEQAVALGSSLAAGVGVNLTIGLIQVPEGTGTTVLWSPFTDGDAPWIWWDFMHLINEEAVADVVSSQQVLSGRRVVDSKAMRKVRNTELQLVVESATLSGMTTSSVDVFCSGRVLAGS